MRAAAFVVLAFAVAGGDVQAQPGLPDNALDSRIEARIAGLSNAFRRGEGLRPLARNDVLTDTARGYAAYLARSGKFSHDADGRDPAARAEAAGYAYCQLDENIARIEGDGDMLHPLSEMFMQGWEKSPGHRRNLLDPWATETGVGVARVPGQADAYVAVQEFGRPLSARYSFRVANHAGRPVGYRLNGEAATLPPSALVTVTLCTPAAVSFEGVADAGRVPLRPGGVYWLRPDRSGGVRMTVAPPPDADPPRMRWPKLQ